MNTEIPKQYAASAARVLDTATKRGAAYADVQFWIAESETIYVASGVVRSVDSSRTVGYGVRALVNGAWGFAGSDRFADADLDAAAARAVSIAQASALVEHRVRAVTPNDKFVDTWSTRVAIEPTSIPLGKKIDHLLQAEKALHVDKSVVFGYAFSWNEARTKEFYSSGGSAIAQHIVQSGAGTGCTPPPACWSFERSARTPNLAREPTRSAGARLRRRCRATTRTRGESPAR